MKVKIGNYRSRWCSYVHLNYMDKKYGRGWEENETRFEHALEKIEDGLQWLYNHTINLILDNIPRKIKVRIDRYDTWSMDETLTLIILPMLHQLKEQKIGAPFVDDEDVPEDIRSTNAKPKENEYDTDEFWFKRWDWVIDEMIWSFEYNKLCIDSNDVYDDPHYKEKCERMNKGFILFGKYYGGLWS